MKIKNNILIISSIILSLVVILTCVFFKVANAKSDVDVTQTSNSATTVLDESTTVKNSIVDNAINDVTKDSPAISTQTKAENITSPVLTTKAETTTKKQETTTKKNVETTTKKNVTTTKKIEITTAPAVKTIFNAGNLNANTPVTPIERELFNLVNQERKNNGLPELVWNDNVHFFAVLRAEENITFQGHARPDGRKFSSILTDYGVSYNALSENIAIGSNKNNPDAAQILFGGWMDSESHKNALLSTSYKYSAIGVVYDSSGRIYAVQLFYR